MTGERVQFGLIGFGAWGQCHAGAIAKSPGAQLVAICARSAATQAAARQAYPQATVCADFHDMLARVECEAVAIVLPSHLHFDVAQAALQAGKHVLLEKPMCLMVSDCEALIRCSREHDRLLAIGHELRLSSLWARARQLIDEGVVGTPQYVLVELSRRPYRLGADGWRYDISRVGNWILEEPIHFFDLARWYLSSVGEPVSVYARANSRQPDHPELQDNFSAIVDFPGGAYAVVTQTLSAFEHHQTVKVSGTKGAIWASWSGVMDRTRHPSFYLKVFDGQTVETLPIDKPTGELFELEDQVDMFVDAVLSNRAPAATGEDGKWSVALCVAAQRSVETGRPVPLSEVL
jgi:myo-inositol 2-dehydrogenase/D-chiro-inositol 1-dehydrogenase